MLSLSIFVSIGLPLSLLCWLEIDFSPIFLLHITLTIIVLACNFRPNKSNYKLDLVVMILILTLQGLRKSSEQLKIIASQQQEIEYFSKFTIV
jgi:hypothetical protein